MKDSLLEINILSHLDQLLELVSTLEDEQYTFVPQGNSSSVGQHLRHTLEIFILLVENYDSGRLDYESRSRNLELERNRALAVNKLNYLKENFNKPDKPIELLNNQLIIKTSYARELLYQLEHIIHHNAIIRPIVASFLGNAIQENFGYAPATIKYQAKHVSS
jgi:hypothetical protein